jgi:CheY-like chemotaxis protein
MPNLIHIVVADDDEDYRFLFEQSLHETGTASKLSFATNGLEVIALVNTMSTPPDIIFLDINMPKMDGLTALERIRANEVLLKVPIIIFSATTDPAKIQDAYQRGATLFVTKPAHYIDYLSLLRSLLISKHEAETPGNQRDGKKQSNI